jgi:predicted NAD-dependent protein-ADP-ribosyltransferase YbiA (DUF1768 family)
LQKHEYIAEQKINKTKNKKYLAVSSGIRAPSEVKELGKITNAFMPAQYPKENNFDLI